MAAVNKMVREVSELGAKDGRQAKMLLKERWQIQAAEKEVETKKKANSEAFMELMNSLDIESIFDKDIGTATVATRTSTTIKEDLLTGALRAVGLNEKKIKLVLEACKVTSESKPFVTFRVAPLNNR